MGLRLRILTEVIGVFNVFSPVLQLHLQVYDRFGIDVANNFFNYSSEE